MISKHLKSTNPNAKLTMSEVKEIRQILKRNQYTHWQIARMFGVERQVITNIHRGTTWKWLK